MKVLFLLYSTYLFDRLGIMLLTSLLKKDGHKVHLIVTEQLKEKTIIKKVKSFCPDIIAYSVMTLEANYYLKLNGILKREFDFFSVFGGPHPTFSPEMIECEGVDAICRGEGDIVFPELINCLEKKINFYGVNNFWFKKNEHIIRNPIGSLVKDLNELPFSDRQLIYEADPALKKMGMKLIVTMRGCPFKCTYCFNHKYNELVKGKGSMLRYRSVSNVIEEMKLIKSNLYLDRLCIMDDVFLIKPSGWIEEFSNRNNEFSKIKLWCNVRAEFINEKTVENLKKIRCESVNMGIECGDEKIARDLLKRNTNNYRIEKAHNLLKKNKIKVQLNNLLGLPVNNALKIDLKTLDFNIKLRPYNSGACLVFLYPKTKILEIAQKKGIVDVFNKSFVKECDNYKLYKYNGISNNMKIVNLHRLFGFIVNFPVLRPATEFLISLPFTAFYTLLYFGLYSYKSFLNNVSLLGKVRMLFFGAKFYFRFVSSIVQNDRK